MRRARYRGLAGFEHAREPVERGVGIGVADGFVERGDEVEMLLAGLSYAEEFSLQDIFEEILVMTWAPFSSGRALRTASSSVL